MTQDRWIIFELIKGNNGNVDIVQRSNPKIAIGMNQSNILNDDVFKEVDLTKSEKSEYLPICPLRNSKTEFRINKLKRRKEIEIEVASPATQLERKYQKRKELNEQINELLDRNIYVHLILYHHYNT